MRVSTSRWLSVFVAISVCFWMAACSNETRPNAEGADESAGGAEGVGEHGEGREDGGEHARSEGTGEQARSEGSGEHARSEGTGEHAEGDEHGSEEEGEESGVYIGAAETWDVTRRGARLVLAFNPATNAFVGSVENTTQETLCAVRVEVHLSTGAELGPTERTDLPPGQTIDVELPSGGEAFDTWTAHPELSPCSGG